MIAKGVKCSGSMRGGGKEMQTVKEENNSLEVCVLVRRDDDREWEGFQRLKEVGEIILVEGCDGCESMICMEGKGYERN